MASVTLQVRIPHENGLPEDTVVHTWACAGTQEAADMAVTFAARLQQFYTATTAPVTTAMRTFLTGALNLDAATIRAYDIADPEPRVPVLDSAFAIGPSISGNSGMAAELAVCISFKADTGSGVVAARRRGRVYFGPLNNSAGTFTSGGNSVVNPGFIATANARAKALCDQSTDSCFWGVWSRSDGVVRRVTSGWCDNAWDIQRKRGEKATTRSTWTAAP